MIDRDYIISLDTNDLYLNGLEFAKNSGTLKYGLLHSPSGNSNIQHFTPEPISPLLNSI